ncbi:MAG: hypothetical protein ACPGSI_15830, partial [Pikeienuella sp.]
LDITGDATVLAGTDVTLTGTDFGGVTTITNGGNLSLTDTDALANLTIRSDGDATLEQLIAKAVLDVDAGGDVIVEDILVDDGLLVLAGGSIAFTGLVLEDDAALSAGEEITIDGFSVANLEIEIGGDLTLSGGEAALLDIDADGAVDLSNARLDALEIRSGSTRLDAVRVVGDANLVADAGDLELGAFQVGGNLDADVFGRVLTIDSDFVLDAVNVIDENGPREIAAETLATLVRVDGNAAFDAGGDVLLADDAIGVTGDNDFGGDITVSGVNIVINDETDITVGAAGLTATGTTLLEAGGGISDAVGAVLTLDGDALFRAGADIILDNNVHVIGGAIAAEGDAITLTEAGTIVLSEIIGRGDFTVIAGATGNTTEAAITQVSASAVQDHEVSDVQPIRTINGPIVVNGDTVFTTALDLAIAVDDASLTGNRDLTINDRANIFGGALSIARISGDVLFVEESGVRSIGADDFDNNLLTILNFEVGGSSTIRTTDNIIFTGRLTSLDDATNAARLARTVDGDTRDQGNLNLAEADRRVFIHDGENLVIDTTGGGVALEGRNVRFDGAVDGVNDAPSEGSPSIATERDGLGGININAGVSGEIRFRDFVGAASPIGDATFRGGALILGVTFADEKPGVGVVDDDRFLFNRANPDDFFFAHDMFVDVSQEFSAFVPVDQAAQFVLNDSYFGVNLAGFTFGQELQPSVISVAGFLANSRNRAQGLVPFGPRGSQFTFNDCVIGDVNDCSTLPSPDVTIDVSVDVPLLLDVNEADLLELFTSFGNEELWGVPQSFFSDIGAGPEGATTETGGAEGEAPRRDDVTTDDEEKDA